MEYEVVLTVQAKEQFREILQYLLYHLKSKQAAMNVTDDFEKTIVRLSHVAGSLKLCEDEYLRARGYRTIHFMRHRYFIVYRIDAYVVYVDGIYHDLQDYEHVII